MDAEELTRTLVSALPKGVPGLFNPWADVCGDVTRVEWAGGQAAAAAATSELRCGVHHLRRSGRPGYAPYGSGLHQRAPRVGRRRAPPG